MSALVDIEAALTAVHGANWDTYRLATGGWCVQVKGETGAGLHRQKTAHGATLVEALTGAIDIRFMTVVPLRPTLFLCRVEKGAREWLVVARYLDGGDAGTVRVGTKREASERAERGERVCREQLEAWHGEWAAVVDGGVEGVDWEWER